MFQSVLDCIKSAWEGRMDQDDDGFKGWAAWKEPLAESQVEVVFDRERGNAVALEGKAKELADKIWNKVLEKNPSFFNATKFRLAEIDESGETVKLLMGITDYKTFLTTNRASDPELVASLPDPMDPVLANVLGVSALVVTQDGMTVLQRRSFFTAEFRGWWDVPGGHPEPSKAKLEREGSFSVEEGSRAKRELFQSAADEVHDELNIPYDQMLPPLFMGVVRARASRWRPSAVFLIPVQMTADELAEKFIEGGKEAAESTSMALFSARDVAESKLSSPARIIRPRHNESETNEYDDPQTLADVQHMLVPSAGFAFQCLKDFRLDQFSAKLL